MFSMDLITPGCGSSAVVALRGELDVTDAATVAAQLAAATARDQVLIVDLAAGPRIRGPAQASSHRHDRGRDLSAGTTRNAGGRASVFEAADIREWRGHDVVDAEGHKIGELEAVYVDTATDLSSLGAVETGLPTRHRLLVRDAPSVGTDAELPAADQEATFQHYDMPNHTGSGGERRLARR